jgi:hypothetical protein
MHVMICTDRGIFRISCIYGDLDILDSLLEYSTIGVLVSYHENLDDVWDSLIDPETEDSAAFRIGD